MENIYITGHRNPDLDSICSAMAYAALKNIIDPGSRYVPVRCGHMSESVKSILNAMEIQAPPYMKNVYTKVSDVMLLPDVRLTADSLLTDAARFYSSTSPSAAPVFDEKGYRGLVTINDVTDWLMGELREHGSVSGIPAIGEIMGDRELTLQANQTFEEGAEAMSQPEVRGLAVLDGEEFLGYVTRRCFMNRPAYKVILVDHNEAGQSIKGIETAELVEIIDHHRLDSLKTALPIFIDAEPVGSTCTIVYQQYLRHGLVPAPEVAKVLLTGLISDTLILRSPTTTAVDVNSAKALAEICGEEVQAFGNRMFANVKGLAQREPMEAIGSDFKTYKENGTRLGIGQCEATTLADLEDYRQTYAQALEAFRQQNGLDWALLMITDVMKEESVLLTTDFKAVRHLPYAQHGKGILEMPGVMSRKKQLLPEILHAVTVM